PAMELGHRSLAGEARVLARRGDEELVRTVAIHINAGQGLAPPGPGLVAVEDGKRARRLEGESGPVHVGEDATVKGTEGEVRGARDEIDAAVAVEVAGRDGRRLAEDRQ